MFVTPRAIILSLFAVLVSLPAALAQKSTAIVTDTKTYFPIPGFDKSAIDSTADPCTDFYKYACGNFSKLHPIPNDMSDFDQFANLQEYNTQALHGILEKAAAAHPSAGTNEQKVADYYTSCLNTAAINKAGLAPIQTALDGIRSIKNRDELAPVIAHFTRISAGAFLDFGSQQDFKNATEEIAVIDQGGLGLPEKDYYLRTGAKDEELRQQYVQHLTKMLQLLGATPDKAAAHAKAVMEMETALAKVSLGNVERRDPNAVYHPMPVSTFAGEVPLLHAEQFLKDVGAPPVTKLNVTSPEFFKGLNQVLSTTSMETIQSYLSIRLAEAESSRLPEAFDEEHFDFYGRKLTGTPEQKPRWKRCVAATDRAMGEALGQVYVKQYFAGDSKAKTLAEVHAIEGAMNQDLSDLEWMSAPTREKAKEKLRAVVDKIGYPDKWRSYAALKITPDDAFGNALRANEFESDYQLNKIGKPVDKGEWEMSPPTVNAYYDDSMNTINFPAGILQPAFYDKNASDATNYGHIGAVVGHELTHGFDDQGRKFDAQGNLNDWWTPEDLKKFESRTDCLVSEYSGFTAVDDLHVNGKLTLGENTADNGGMRLALMALMAQAAQTKMNMNAKDTGGSTPMQQLFVGWAQNWCSTERPELLRMLVQTDSHSPNRIRANGVVVNMPEFGKAFGCKQGQPMYPVKMCRVW